MTRLATTLLLLAAAAPAGDLGPTLRRLRHDDRERRREALEDLAEGRVRAANASEARKLLTALKRFLSARRPGRERAAAVRALARLGGPRVFEVLLAHLGDETDDRVVAAAARAFRSAPEPVALDLVRFIDKAREPVARAVFVRMLGEMPGEEARRRIRRRAAIADHWCPRSAAIHALGRDRSPESYAVLAALLDEEDPALFTAAVQSLTYLSGKRFGLDRVAWKTWWNTRDETEPLEAAAADDEEKPDARRYAHERPPENIRPYYFGIPIRAQRVALVFDVSASMRYKLPLAYDQLSRAVKALPATTSFEVVFFNEHVWPWRGRLSSADPVTKQLLLRHLPTIEIKSYTNLFDSLEKALRLDVQEIFVISDGAPNRGRKQLPRDILNGVRKLNTKGVPIHTISVVRVVDGDEHVSLLQALAEQNGGQSVQRTLR